MLRSLTRKDPKAHKLFLKIDGLCKLLEYKRNQKIGHACSDLKVHFVEPRLAALEPYFELFPALSWLEDVAF